MSSAELWTCPCLIVATASYAAKVRRTQSKLQNPSPSTRVFQKHEA